MSSVVSSVLRSVGNTRVLITERCSRSAVRSSVSSVISDIAECSEQCREECNE